MILPDIVKRMTEHISELPGEILGFLVKAPTFSFYLFSKVHAVSSLYENIFQIVLSG